MRTFRFDPRDGELDAYGSSGVLFSAFARSAGETQLACLRLEPGGTVGRHPAPKPQLFAVVEGAGPGGMTVLVLEGEGVRGADAAS